MSDPAIRAALEAAALAMRADRDAEGLYCPCTLVPHRAKRDQMIAAAIAAFLRAVAPDIEGRPATMRDVVTRIRHDEFDDLAVAVEAAAHER